MSSAPEADPDGADRGAQTSGQTAGHTPVIVVPAFRRAGALSRLLSSLDAAAAHAVKPTLIISLEGGATADVVAVAEDYRARTDRYEVIVRHHEQNLGLRRHIIECAGHSAAYGSVIILEDDLYVDPYFYHYAAAALDHYGEDERVGGIALYAPQINEFCGLPFTPQANGYSTYPMQSPCSWGQAWTAGQWSAFLQWYQGVDETVVKTEERNPPSLRLWPESSWKKYFATWLLKTGRSFIYPYQSYTTNFADMGGTHGEANSTYVQVAMAAVSRPAPQFRFCPTVQPEVSYDSYLEASGAAVYRALGRRADDVTVDTYGLKPRALLLTTPETLSIRSANQATRAFGLRFRPIEANIGVTPPDEGKRNLTLAPSGQFAEGRHAPDFAEYVYRYGGNLPTLHFKVAVARVLPSAVWGYVRRRLKR